MPESSLGKFKNFNELTDVVNAHCNRVKKLAINRAEEGSILTFVKQGPKRSVISMGKVKNLEYLLFMHMNSILSHDVNALGILLPKFMKAAKEVHKLSTILPLSY